MVILLKASSVGCSPRIILLSLGSWDVFRLNSNYWILNLSRHLVSLDVSLFQGRSSLRAKGKFISISDSSWINLEDRSYNSILLFLWLNFEIWSSFRLSLLQADCLAVLYFFLYGRLSSLRSWSCGILLRSIAFNWRCFILFLLYFLRFRLILSVVGLSSRLYLNLRLLYSTWSLEILFLLNLDFLIRILMSLRRFLEFQSLRIETLGSSCKFSLRHFILLLCQILILKLRLTSHLPISFVNPLIILKEPVALV